MNDNHPNPIDFLAVLASFTTMFAGWSTEQWFGFFGVLGIAFTAFMQWRRDRRESRLHAAQMRQIEHDNSES